ncbi:MAG: ABC transporter substrate-binding protein [Flavobacteriaceae bacterium]|nr:ABC transporter substrate-binding protein [Flavobacteriaceae bacterium]
MLKKLFPLLILPFIFSCKHAEEKKTITPTTPSIAVQYAQGFEIENFETYKIVTLKNPWPGATETYTYALVQKGATVPETLEVTKVVEVPLKNIVVTSTTHIPSLEMLEVEDKLIGFPNLDYISSEKTRALIDLGAIKELGKNEDINTEVLIDLSPDAVVTFAVEGQNKTVSTIQKTGIPVLYNADWTETHPLGKAEWIKFFGVLFGKEKEADRIFSDIEKNYNESKQLASTSNTKPTVLSGAMFKDVWYLPQGDSWAAQFIKDANGDYLWGDSEGTGSLSLNLESVLEKAQQADFWIGPSQFSSYAQMEEAHSVYTEFKAFQEKKVFSFTTKKGATGGVIYYELAPNRPDLVLKDIIKILHPELLPDYELFFFAPLQ